MKLLSELSLIIKDLLGDDKRPVVVFSSAWPFFYAVGRNNVQVAEDILNVLIEAIGDRSLLMPTFSHGYIDGFCDLDNTPSSTGVFSEIFRKKFSNIRTLSAFFSFSIRGGAKNELADLLPIDAWGDNSVYHWMENQNVRFLLLGTDPSNCSFIHRIEWLLKDKIKYRYKKKFCGTLRRNGKDIKCHERLFVRCLTPEVKNDFTILNGLLEMSGILKASVAGIPITLYDARQVMSSVFPVLDKDPLFTVINKNDFRTTKE